MYSVRKKNFGLTLIELLVAISVLGFVAILGWRGLDSIVRARIALTNEMEQTRGIQLAFAQLQSDCTHLADSYILPNHKAISIAQDRLTLIRSINADNQPSRLQVISYAVRKGVLIRHESTPTRDLAALEAMWLAAARDVDTNSGVKLRSDVAAITMRLWINGRWQTADNATFSTTPTTQPASSLSPTGLEIKLQLRERGTTLLKVFLLGVA